jgi:hypothetical protein
VPIKKFLKIKYSGESGHQEQVVCKIQAMIYQVEQLQGLERDIISIALGVSRRAPLRREAA